MPSEYEAIDFLIRYESLRLGETPWTTYTENDDVYPIYWKSIFPRQRSRRDGVILWDNSGDDWKHEWDEEFLGDIEGTLSNQPNNGSNAMHDGMNGNEDSESGGWDRCAWYQPIHYFGYDWGIFIREECVQNAAIDIARFLFLSPKDIQTIGFLNIVKALWRAGFLIYFLHEHFHHKIECLGFRLHVVEQKSCYLPYVSNVYNNCKGSNSQLEEALANADSFLRLSNSPYNKLIPSPILEATKDYLRWRFPNDPPGYSQAMAYLTKYQFDNGENVLQARVKEAIVNPAHNPVDWDLAPRMTQSFLNVRSEIWVVVPKGKIPHTPHGALPAPTCSTKKMKQLCEKAGYQVVKGGKGSHIKLKKRNSPMIVLPGNKNSLSTKVAKKVLHAIGNYKLHQLPGLLSGEIPIT